MKRAVACIAMLTAWMVSAPSADAARPLGKRIVLDSGMVLLLAEKHEIPMVTVSVSLQAGGLAEPAEKPGLASLTASLLMQGTKKRSATQISREIDFAGGSLSISGGNDFATANLRVLKKDLRTGFELLSDVLRNPLFEQKEVDRKVKEILAEIQRQKEEPETIASEAFSRAVYGNHPYGRIGEDIAAYLSSIDRKDILDFYADHYGPRGTVFAVVGDVSEKEIRSLIRSSLGSWKQREVRAKASPAPPKRAATEVIKLEKKITQANIAVGHLGISRENPDYYAVAVMNFILGGGGFSSRLMDNIRDNRGLAYDVHSIFSAQKEPGAFRVWVQTKNETANEAIAEIRKELERIRTEPVAEKELAGAKAYLTGSFPLRMDTYAKIAGMLTSMEIYALGMDYPERFPVLINAVTAEDVLRAARKYIDPERMVIVVLGNQEIIQLRN